MTDKIKNEMQDAHVLPMGEVVELTPEQQKQLLTVEGRKAFFQNAEDKGELDEETSEPVEVPTFH